MTQPRRRNRYSTDTPIRALFERGEFDGVIAQAKGLPSRSEEETLLYARALLKVNAPEALRVLTNAALRKKANAVEHTMLLAIGYSRTSRDPIAYDLFSKAYGAAGRLTDRELRSEIAYWWARALVDDSRFAEARELLPRLVETSTESQTLRAMHFRATLAGREDRFADQAAALTDVLRYLADTQEPHIELAAHSTETLAALARELHIPEARTLIERALQTPWPSFFARQRFQTLKAIGWVCALQGDVFNAFRYLKQATQTVDALPPEKRAAWKTVALLDRAYLARCIGEYSWSRQELAEAEESSKHVAWEQTNDERIGLLLFAELFVHLDPGKSAAYLARFEQLADLKEPLVNYSFGPRMRAIADYTAGVVHACLGHRARGIDAIRRSFRVFDRIGYDWRAGRSALRLHEFTKDPNMLSIAAEKLRNYGASWLGKELQSHGALAVDVDLTPMQQRILRLVLQGNSTDEIAAAIQRSKFTIRNHIKQLLKIFGVSSRPALLAEAGRRNLR